MKDLIPCLTIARPLGNFFSVLSLLLLGTHHLQAGMVPVPAVPTASGPGLFSMSYNNTVNADLTGNDDVVGSSPNLLRINQKSFNSINYIDILFTVDETLDTGSVTEYELREGVDNSTGIDWTDYHIVLGFGTGIDFVQSTPGDGLDFDAPDENSVYDFGPFTTMVIAEDTIDVEGGIFPNGAFFNFTFPIDVPDGITEFTIRQLPTIAIPEPSTWVLALFALAGLRLTRLRTL
ncbi:MAG: hypothetical protein GXP26_14220 [Planctomycetes bacterium]|nr:hypothetical protein [Planctomycetota bacterium]